jgi:hypothetical protein
VTRTPSVERKAEAESREAGQWIVERAEGWGPFRTRVVWRARDGSTTTWSSRSARKRAVIGLRVAAAIPARRQSILNSIAAVAFTIGGSLFALGAALAQLGSADPTASACIYFAGGLFFNTGGYATVLQAVNSPRGLEADGSPRYERWRWWSWEPERIEWVSAVVLFGGTLVFGINLLDSFLQGLTVKQQNRLIWAPDIVGCAMFLISGHLALAEICHGRLCVRRRDLGWWIAALNQLGSYLFLVSALAAFIRPETSSAVNAAVANWGTFGGALCFAAGGVLQVFERPTSPGSDDAPTAADGTSFEASTKGALATKRGR